MKRFALPIILLGAAVLLVGLFVVGNSGGGPAAEEVARVGEKQEDQGQKHIAPGQERELSPSNLPTSGSHYAVAAPWGIKTEEIADEMLVHNMEHGGIVIVYQPDLPKEQLDKLVEVFNSLPRSERFNSVKAILAPRAKNNNPIQLGAWTYTLDLNTVDKDKILEFYNSHLDKGPELVP